MYEKNINNRLSKSTKDKTCAKIQNRLSKNIKDMQKYVEQTR